MKAVFVQKSALLRDSRLDPAAAPENWHLAPATVESVRQLAGDNTLLFLYGMPSSTNNEGEHDDSDFGQLVQQIEAGGGRVDGVITCPHDDPSQCSCWGDTPTLLWLPALQFDLELGQCYVVGDTLTDVNIATVVGARPMIVLGERTIGSILGDLPPRKDFPLVPDLTRVVSYMGIEEEITELTGLTRTHSPTPPMDQDILNLPQLPNLQVVSRLAKSLTARNDRARLQLRDMTRWLSFLVIGAIGLSLGIAYLLTHLYRIQQFPDFVYYVTLQFIPRPVRGALFILWGIGIILIAVRSFNVSIGNWRKPRT